MIEAKHNNTYFIILLIWSSRRKKRMLIYRIGRREISDGTNCLSKGRTMGKHGASLEKGVILFSLISSVQVEIWLKKLGSYLFFFWPYLKACRIYFPDRELDPCPQKWEHGVLAIGPPGTFQGHILYLKDLGHCTNLNFVLLNNKCFQ